MARSKKTKVDPRARLASQFYEAMERKLRKDGDEDSAFYSLKRGSPEWMTDALREAHDSGNVFPNDWVYATANGILGNMADREPADWEDAVSEWADSEVDVYNAARTAWLASNLQFGGIVDEAVEEMGHSDQGIFGDIGIGQYRLAERIAYALIQAVTAQAEAD